MKNSIDTYIPFVLTRLSDTSSRSLTAPRVLQRTATSFQARQSSSVSYNVERGCIASSSAASFDVLGIGIGLGAVPFSERANRED